MNGGGPSRLQMAVSCPLFFQGDSQIETLPNILSTISTMAVSELSSSSEIEVKFGKHSVCDYRWSALMLGRTRNLSGAELVEILA